MPLGFFTGPEPHLRSRSLERTGRPPVDAEHFCLSFERDLAWPALPWIVPHLPLPTVQRGALIVCTMEKCIPRVPLRCFHSRRKGRPTPHPTPTLAAAARRRIVCSALWHHCRAARTVTGLVAGLCCVSVPPQQTAAVCVGRRRRLDLADCPAVLNVISNVRLGEPPCELNIYFFFFPPALRPVAVTSTEKCRVEREARHCIVRDLGCVKNVVLLEKKKKANAPNAIFFFFARPSRPLSQSEVAAGLVYISTFTHVFKCKKKIVLNCKKNKSGEYITCNRFSSGSPTWPETKLQP